MVRYLGMYIIFCCEKHSVSNQGAICYGVPSSGFLKRGPQTPLGARERFSGGHEQRPSLGSFAVILHNPSVTIHLVFAS